MSLVLLVAFTAALVVAWSASGALAVLARFVPAVTRIGAQPSTALRAAWVMTPWVLAGVTFLLIVVPSPYLGCHCFTHAPHHPHLCLQHPWLARPLLSKALMVSALWGAFALWRAGRIGAELARAERWAGKLRHLPAELVAGIEVRLAHDLGLGAFTVGIWKPVVVVDRVLWDRLDPQERLAVIHHEAAHGARRDSLTLACLRVASALLPWPVNASWLRGWKAASEATCDRYAALQLGDATCVAMALVSVERLRASGGATGRALPALGVAAGTELEVRVRALLEDDTAISASLANDLWAIGIVVSGLTALLLAVPGNTLHHAAESLLGLLVH